MLVILAIVSSKIVSVALSNVNCDFDNAFIGEMTVAVHS